MPSLAVYGSTEDGYIGYGGGLNKTATTMLTGAESSGGQDVNLEEYHSFMFFDTSSLGEGVTIKSAILALTVTARVGDWRAMNLRVYGCSGCTGSTLEIADYGDVVSGGLYLFTVSGYIVGLRKNYTIPVGSLSIINKTGYTNFETDAAWGGGIDAAVTVAMATQDHATESLRPLLTVNYDYMGISNAELRNAELRNAKP
jgi:hypothetical protein